MVLSLIYYEAKATLDNIDNYSSRRSALNNVP